MKAKNRTAEINEWKRKNTRRIPFELSPWEYEVVKTHIDLRGEPMNTFIKRAIRTQIMIDNGE